MISKHQKKNTIFLLEKWSLSLFIKYLFQNPQCFTVNVSPIFACRGPSLLINDWQNERIKGDLRAACC